MTIEELGRLVCAGTVKVRGHDLPIVALSDKLLAKVAEAFTQPRAPMVKDPTKGSMAAPIADVQDDKYRKAVRAWNVETRAAQAVLGLDLAFVFEGQTIKMSDCRGLEAAAYNVRLQAATDQLREVLSGDEIDGVVNEMDALTRGATARAEKN